MNKKVLATAMVVLGLFPSLLFAQLYRMDVDVQKAGEQKVIDRVFTGNTIGLRVSFYDGSDAISVTNWTMRFMYGYGKYDTNSMVPIVGTTGDSSNVVLFQSTTNVFFSENENYYFSIVGTNATAVKTFARGRMIEEYDPATGGAGGYPLPMPWGLYSFATHDWVAEYVRTNEFEVVVGYGTDSNTAYRGDWGHSVSGRVDSVSNLARTAQMAATNAQAVASNAAAVAEAALTTNESRKATLRGGGLISDNSWVYRITSITNASGNISSNWTGEYRTNWTGAAGTSAIHRTGGRFFFTGSDGLRFIGGPNMADNVTNWVYVFTNGAWRDRLAGAVFVAIDTNQSYGAAAQSLGINTESARTNIPYLENAVGLDIVDRLLVVEKPEGYYSAAPTLPAISAMGYDIRQNGRMVLWLNSAGYTLGGTNYDFPADLFFGTGTNMTDASIRWTISSRPVVPRASGHTYDQLAIFEADGAGDTTGTVKRIGISPDRGGDPGSIWLGRAWSSDPVLEANVSNSTVAVVDRAGTASLRIVADETDGTTNRAVFSMKQGTNIYEKALAGGAITETINGVDVSSGGGGISAATATSIAQRVIGAATTAAFSNVTFGATATVMCATGTWYDAATRTAYTTSCPSGTSAGAAMTNSIDVATVSTNVSGTWAIDFRNGAAQRHTQVGAITAQTFAVDSTAKVSTARVVLKTTTNAITWSTNLVRFVPNSIPIHATNANAVFYFEAHAGAVRAVYLGVDP